MISPGFGQPSRLEKSLPLILGACFLALEILDCGIWHPGFSYLDEGSGAVCNLQEWIEGRALPFELFKGCIHGHLSAMMAWIFGPSIWNFRILSLGSLALESFLLYRVALDLAGRRAALWALTANLVSAQIFLRARFALSCTLLPSELLLAVVAMRGHWGRFGSVIFGALAGVLLLDYEGWLIALPVLALVWAGLDPHERPQAVPALAGFVCVLGLLGWASWEGLGEHFSRRLRSLPQAGLGPGMLILKFAKSFFLGGDCIAYLGVSGRSFVPAWAIPGFLAGLVLAFHGGRTMLLWLLLGLIPAVTVAASAEPNRIIVAWPAIAILSGIGLAWMATRVSAVFCIALLLAGLGWEATGYRDSMRKDYGQWYGESEAVRRLSARYPRRRLVNELGPPYSSQQRFAWGPRKVPEGNLFLLPNEFLPGLGGGGIKVKFEPMPQGRLSYVDDASAELSGRLLAISQGLLALRRGLPRFAFRRHRDLLEEYLAEGHGDSWTRTAVLEEALTWSSSLGQVPPLLVGLSLEDALVSSSAPLWLSEKARQSGDQAFARRLCARAMQIDPRRPCP